MLESRVTLKNKKLFICGLFLFICLIAFRNVSKIPIPSFLFLGLYFLIAFLSDRDGFAALCVALIPLSAVFQYKYAILLLMLVYAVKFPRDIKINSSFILFLIILIWELLHGFIYSLSLFETLRSFAELILLIFFFCIEYKNFNYKFVCRVFACVSLSIMIILFYQLLIKVNFDISELFTGNASYRFGWLDSAASFGGNFNPNGLGYICNLSLVGIFQIITSKQGKLIDYISIPFLIFFGVLTLSRTFLLCFIVDLFLIILCGKISITQRLKRIAFFGFVISIFLIFILNFMPTIVEGFTKRLNEEDLTGGRLDLIPFYLEHIFSNVVYLFFGIGMQDVSIKIQAIYPGSFTVPHNGIIESLVIWGLPGIIFLFLTLISIIDYSKFFKTKKMINIIPFILTILYIQAGQFFTNGIVMLSLVFVYASCCYNFE